MTETHAQAPIEYVGYRGTNTWETCSRFHSHTCARNWHANRSYIKNEAVSGPKQFTATTGLLGTGVRASAIEAHADKKCVLAFVRAPEFTCFKRWMVFRCMPGENDVVACLNSCSYFTMIRCLCSSGSTGCKHCIDRNRLLFMRRMCGRCRFCRLLLLAVEMVDFVNAWIFFFCSSVEFQFVCDARKWFVLLFFTSTSHQRESNSIEWKFQDERNLFMAGACWHWDRTSFSQRDVSRKDTKGTEKNFRETLVAERVYIVQATCAAHTIEWTNVYVSRSSFGKIIFSFTSRSDLGEIIVYQSTWIRRICVSNYLFSFSFRSTRVASLINRLLYGKPTLSFHLVRSVALQRLAWTNPNRKFEQNYIYAWRRIG